MNKFEKVFQIFCIAGAVGMTAYSVMKYTRNESVVTIYYKEFHATPEDVYPSITLCFVNTNKSEIARLRNRLKNFEKSQSMTYDNLTMKMQDFGTYVKYRVFQKELSIKAISSG